MNLIVNMHLDQTERQLIQEITLKKRQSKKSTMSAKQLAARQQLAKELMLEVHEKDASIRLNKSRLAHLNSELEQRLFQYEYLVAQEKALLSAYNMMLFTNEGVNNFAYLSTLSSSSLS